MSSTKLIRRSGPFTALAGVLVVLFPLLHPNHDPNGYRSFAWIPVHLMLHVAAVLTLFALTALYARQIERSGWLGLVGYLAAFIGTASILTAAMIELYIIPYLGMQMPDLENTPPPGIDTAFLIVNGTLAVGYVLFGIATMRAGVWPRGAALLLAVGAPLFSLGWTLTQVVLGIESDALSTVGDVLFSAGLIWMGWALWTSGAERPVTATAHVPVPA